MLCRERFTRVTLEMRLVGFLHSSIPILRYADGRTKHVMHAWHANNLGVWNVFAHAVQCQDGSTIALCCSDFTAGVYLDVAVAWVVTLYYHHTL